MRIETLHSLFLTSTGVTTDSRHCPQGSIFIALKGETFNGNKFASEALSKGCIYAVIDEPGFAVPADDRYIVVDNGLMTLQQLANYHRRQMKASIIGITGTNGKTTTKELIAAVLSCKYTTLYTQGNLNNHIGVPLTLLRLTTEHQMAVIEMGASHPGDIKELVEIAEPDYGIITNVGKAHLEGFGSFAKVIETKGELFDFLRKRSNARVFVNTDDEILVKMSSGMNVVSYGTDNQFVTGQIVNNSPFLGFRWKTAKQHAAHSIDTQLIGAYNFTNALAAVAIGCFFDVDSADIDGAISRYQPSNSRSQLMKTDHNTLIIDAYNANPTSMMAALENFRNMQATHKMVILGDMLELGSEQIAEHETIIQYIQDSRFEDVILIGKTFSSMRLTYPSYESVDDLIRILREQPITGKTILIKGSNSIRLRQLPEYL